MAAKLPPLLTLRSSVLEAMVLVVAQPPTGGLDNVELLGRHFSFLSPCRPICAARGSVRENLVLPELVIASIIQLRALNSTDSSVIHIITCTDQNNEDLEADRARQPMRCPEPSN